MDGKHWLERHGVQNPTPEETAKADYELDKLLGDFLSRQECFRRRIARKILLERRPRRKSPAIGDAELEKI
jgi:hypothetical protein